jgi:hypothetical protein
MKNYKKLSFEDLIKIETLMEQDFKPTEIAIQQELYLPVYQK